MSTSIKKIDLTRIYVTLSMERSYESWKEVVDNINKLCEQYGGDGVSFQLQLIRNDIAAMLRSIDAANEYDIRENGTP